MNKRLYLPILAALSATFTSLPCDAQEQRTLYNGQISVQPSELFQKGDSLYIKMEFDVPVKDLKIGSRRSLTLIPVLEGASGRLTLPPVQVNGKNRHKAYRRTRSLEKKQRAEEEFYAVMRSDNRSVIRYNYEIPYQEWMKDARLDIIEDLCGCAGTNKGSTRNRVFDNVELENIDIYIPQPQLSYLRPQAEAVKKRNEIKDVYLDFQMGSAVIYRMLNNNASELESIETMLREIRGDKNIQVQGIRFTGYASPEGSIASNLRLSDLRARSMMNYLMPKLAQQDTSIKAEGGGEDWVNLKKLLEASDIKDKDRLLDIIRQCGTTDACEQKMKTIANGVPYRQMATEIYPKLRRTVCSVDYTVRGFTVEEAREIIKTRPQQLDLNEMYMVAGEYEQGSPEFNEVFEIAVRMFPEDVNANLNAASSALARRDVASAEKYLSKVKIRTRIPEYDNSMGVLCLLKGEYEEAEQYFEAARQAGVEAATANLEELAKKRENEAAILKQKR
jgi:tetratricopeptide (TPR) repeat protein